MSDGLKRVDVRIKLVENEVYGRGKVTKPKDAVRVVADILAELDREQLCVVNLDGAGHPINYNIVSIGDINEALAPVQNIFKTAILSNAASIILLHNHPSSDTSISKYDRNVTKKVMCASVLMNIPLLDHIIVAGGTGKYLSMREYEESIFQTSGYEYLQRMVADGGAMAFQDDVRESGIIYDTTTDTKGRYGIYQITKDGPGEKYQFFGTDFAKENNLKISGSDYSLVYSGDMEEHDTLDSLYEKFNLNRPDDFTGHSLSVSDVILIKTKEATTAYYVDSFGFSELPDFLQERERLIEQPEKEQKEELEKSNRKGKGQTVQEITEKLEKGLEELFDSDKYKEYLSTMAKFHNYSFNNTLLIAMQKPGASLVASYGSWQKNFHRYVKKGEKGIRIIAPAPYKTKREREVIDPNTRQPVKDNSGHVKKEEVEVTVNSFKPVCVFDVSQTEGEPIPQMGAGELLQSVEGYQDFVEAMKEIAPVSISFEEIDGNAKGYFSTTEQRIVVQSGMSESQTLKTLVHEISHSLLHDKDNVRIEGIDEAKKNRSTKEVEAESVAYTVCQHFGIDTSDYSFGYVAGWSSGKEMKELKSSMETIRKTASKVINDLEGKIQELQKEREQNRDVPFMVGCGVREVIFSKGEEVSLAENKKVNRGNTR